MPRRPRSAAPATFFHVINRSVRKTPLFPRSHDYREFLGLLCEGLKRHPVRLLAFCIMSNHWHLVVGPVDPPQLSKLLHWVSTTHAVRLHLRRKTVGQGPVYQGRFKSHVIDSPDQLVRVCRYVERNALRARLVRRAQDWPWCSLAERLQTEPSLPLVTTPFLASQAWTEHVNAPLTVREQVAMRTPVPKTAETVESTPVPDPDPLDDGALVPRRLAGSVKGRKRRIRAA